MLLVLILFFLGYSEGCSRRAFGNGVVCVCNATYCDQVEKVEKIGGSKLKIYYTSEISPGFNVGSASFSHVRNSSATFIRIEGTTTYQRIIGFGGAFTDSTGINIKRLSEGAQQNLLESYFGPNGIGYNLCRVPIGGTDFSPRPYSYDDVDGDRELKHFKLQPEDHLYKIPFIKQAQDLRGSEPFNLLASCWTAPPWMKNRQVWQGYSMLKKKNYQLFVNYMMKFLDVYHKIGIPFWGLTTGNEPLNGFFRLSHTLVNSMGWTTHDMVDWLSENLGPTLKNSSHKNIKLMVHDDATITLPFVVPTLLGNERTLKFIDGVATHWYWDNDMVPEVRDLAKTDKKDIFLLASEACFFQTGPILGSWDRASTLIDSIIEYLYDGFAGWVDWNMVLNSTGGPTYINFLADSPIIISEDAKEFYKQPMFYALGHFSKFVLPGSYHVKIVHNHQQLKPIAFIRPDNMTVVIVSNNGNGSIPIQIEDHSRFSQLVTIPAKSINTILYNTKIL